MFFSFLTLKAGNSRIMPFILVGFIAVLLIWEGIKDFRIQSKAPDKN
jgi:hypothetical protein